MSKKSEASLSTYVLGAFVLWFIFGGDDDNAKQSVASRQTNETIVLAPPVKQPTITVPKTVVAKPSISTRTEIIKKQIKQKVSFNPRTMYVDASRLNVRNGAAKTNKVIWTLKRNEKIRVTAQNGDWLQVTGTRYHGWVFGSYLTNNPAPKQVNVPRTQKKQSAGLSTSRIKKILIKRSHAYYSGNCPCPYNRTSRGHKCGKRSAYSRPGGASPLCYNRDVTAQMVANYRARQ